MPPHSTTSLSAQIKQRLHELADEIERLHGALRALDGRKTSQPSARRSASRAVAPAAKPRAPRTRAPQRPSAPSADSRTTRNSPTRTSRGATKAAVLATLAAGEAMTAGEVAAKTGLARPTVSTTLSNLAKSGEVEKAERGYRLASPSE